MHIQSHTVPNLQHLTHVSVCFTLASRSEVLNMVHRQSGWLLAGLAVTDAGHASLSRHRGVVLGGD